MEPLAISARLSHYWSKTIVIRGRGIRRPVHGFHIGILKFLRRFGLYWFEFTILELGLDFLQCHALRFGNLVVHKHQSRKNRKEKDDKSRSPSQHVLDYRKEKLRQKLGKEIDFHAQRHGAPPNLRRIYFAKDRPRNGPESNLVSRNEEKHAPQDQIFFEVSQFAAGVLVPTPKANGQKGHREQHDAATSHEELFSSQAINLRHGKRGDDPHNGHRDDARISAPSGGLKEDPRVGQDTGLAGELLRQQQTHSNAHNVAEFRSPYAVGLAVAFVVLGLFLLCVDAFGHGHAHANVRGFVSAVVAAQCIEVFCHSFEFVFDVSFVDELHRLASFFFVSLHQQPSFAPWNSKGQEQHGNRKEYGIPIQISPVCRIIRLEIPHEHAHYNSKDNDGFLCRNDGPPDVGRAHLGHVGRCPVHDKADTRPIQNPSH
mmetsp:Transcript_22118/g.54729  ORF Transcript_22118/g.54729 Transcript_22118/m.54729 type:complete len:429 (-) Transcript_22118:872-2158(-)